MTKLKSLIIGSHPDLMHSLPFLLFRAGFEIDAMIWHQIAIMSTLISNYFFVDEPALFPQKLDEMDLESYDFIVVCDDVILKEIKNSKLSLEKKLKLLPVVDEKYFSHLGSKISLSQTLLKEQIPTPPFIVATGQDQVIEAAEKLGFPLMIKVDFSGGGDGVFECNNVDDIKKIDPQKFVLPLLVQKKIEGVEVDLSGFYQRGFLINFGYARPEKTVKKFGPSYLRTYEKLSHCCDEKLFLQMQELGKVLGADGFVNISGIRVASGEVYIFEADMRPTVWADSTRFIGDDLAIKISQWFAKGEVMHFPIVANDQFPETILMPHFLRISVLQILTNRYNVWKYMSFEDLRCVLMGKIGKKIRMFLWRVNRIPTLTIRWFLPNKEDRRRLKNRIKFFRPRTIF